MAECRERRWMPRSAGNEKSTLGAKTLDNCRLAITCFAGARRLAAKNYVWVLQGHWIATEELCRNLKHGAELNMQANTSNECVQDAVLLYVEKHVKNWVERHENINPYTRLRRHRQKGGKIIDQGNLWLCTENITHLLYSKSKERVCAIALLYWPLQPILLKKTGNVFLYLLRND